MTYTQRLALRPTEGSFAGEENESHSVVVKVKNIVEMKEVDVVAELTVPVSY